MKRPFILVSVGLLTLIAAAAAVTWFVLLRPPAAPPGSHPITVLKGATVIDGTERSPITNGIIVIQGTRIAAVGPEGSVQVPPAATVIDATGKYIIPGLADMHNHLRDGIMTEWQNPRPNLSRLLGCGVTMTFAPSMEKDAFVWLKTKITTDDAGPYAHFWGTGPVIMATNASGADYSPRTAAEAHKTVLELKAMNVDAIKVFNDDMSWLIESPLPMLPDDVLKATIKEAHRQNLKVYVHAPVLEHAKAALKAGADGLLHGIISAPVDGELITLMKQNNAIYVSTLSLFESAADLANWSVRLAAFDEHHWMPPTGYAHLQSPAVLERTQGRWTNHAHTKAQLPVARQNLKTVFDVGIPVIAGTDTGLLGVVTCVSSHLELVLLTEAGLKPAEALRAATYNAARMVGREKDLGTIEPGKLADLVILDGNPLSDIKNTRTVHRVVKGGVVHEPQQLFNLAELKHDEVMGTLGD